MKHQLRLAIWLCAATFTALRPVFASALPEVGKTLEGDPLPQLAVRTLDGLLIAPVDLKPDDLRELVGAKLWRFDIKSLDKPVMLESRMELRRPGLEPLVFDDGGIGPFQEGELVFGFMPVNGSDFNQADKIRIYRRITQGRGGSRGAKTIENPMKKLKRSDFLVDSRGAINDDGSVVLIEFKTGEPIKPHKSQLVLMITATKMPEKVEAPK